MRRIVFLLPLLCLAACAGNPRDYGITGPTGPTPPPTPDPAMTGLPEGGATYGPSVMPTTGGGRFWGYN